MDLVIKIPEEDFEIMKHNVAVDNPLCPISQEKMVAIIANGTPLSEGHGDLIDRDALIYKQTHHGDYYTPFELIDRDTLNNAKVIVKADRSMK